MFAAQLTLIFLFSSHFLKLARQTCKKNPLLCPGKKYFISDETLENSVEGYSFKIRNDLLWVLHYRRPIFTIAYQKGESFAQTRMAS